jgi:murein DD-endopeptidase MepM/ murein hydrolase activator NlpD
MAARPRRLRAEALEERAAPANLRITNLVLSDGDGNPISSVPLGEQVVLRADWVSDDLAAGQQYFVRFTLDGVNFDNPPVSADPGPGLQYSEVGMTWFARPGSHTVSATIDGGNSVAETSESDNTRTMTVSPGAVTGPPTKFLYPLSGKPGRNWTVMNYVDVDPRTDQAADYRGGPFQYDGHGGWDIVLANFTRMDAGTPVLAAAAGTVVEVIDGYFDRETSWGGGQDENLVTIDYGNGWRGWYVHFAANTITVKVGDTVAAGQMLGLAGSSGQSSAPHLHFGVYHNWAAVEAMYEPAAYFVSPPAYQADEDPRVIAAGMTNADPTTSDYDEGPSGVSVFPASAGGTVYAWFYFSNLPTDSPVNLRWYRPDGALAATNTWTPTNPRGRYAVWARSVSSMAAFPGTWEVVAEIGGREVGRSLFAVTTGGGPPEVKVTQGTATIPDERTTPIDFGSVSQGGTGPQQTFTINNHGYAPLTTGNLVLPAGFSLVGSFPASVAAGASADFTVRMDTAAVGARFGALRFDTNDADEGTFNFLLKGTVSGTPPAGAPAVGLPGPAVGVKLGDAEKPIDATATFTDADSPTYGGGTLRVEVIQGGSANDRLAVRNQGNAAGQVGVNGTTVSYQGTAIGTLSGGTGSAPLVVTFNTQATPAAVQAVLQNVTYRNASTSVPDTRPRFLTVTAVDPSGQASNVAVKRVSLLIDPVNHAPVAPAAGPTLPAVLEDSSPAGVQVRSFTTGTADDAYDPRGIAVTGLAAGPGGTWQYSLDGGTTWKNFGTVSTAAARLLRETDFVRFVPAANANGGPATLTYRAWDQTTGLFGSTADLTVSGSTGGATAYSTNSATAGLSVTPVNDPPTFTKGADQTVAEDAGAQAVPGWATGLSPGPPDESGQTFLGFTATADNPALFSAGPAVALNGTLTFTPAPDANGTATVTVRLQDNGGTANGGQDTSAPQTFTITITPVNDAPVLDTTGNTALGSILEDQANNGGTLIADLLASAGGDRVTDVDAGAQEGIAVVAADTAHGSWEFTTNNGGAWSPLGAVSAGSARLLAADPSTRVRFVPAADFNGAIPAALTFRAWDHTSGTNGGTASTSPSGGTTAFSAATETASLAVTPVNDPPGFAKGPDQTALEDAGPRAVTGWATALSKGPPDENGQALSFEVTGNTNPALFRAGPAVSGAGTLTYTPAADANGSATITLRARDDGGTANGGIDVSPTQTFTITVTPVNDAPTFTAGNNVRVMQDPPAAQTVPNWARDISSGPADEAGQAVSFEVTGDTDPSLFAVAPAVSPDGTLTFTPAADVHGYATVTLRARDDGGTANGGIDVSPTQLFWIGVNPVNQAPSFTAGPDVLAFEDAGPRTILGWATDIFAGSSFEADQLLTFEVVSNTNPGLFADGLAVSADGTLTFRPAADANGSATIQVRLHDSGGTLFGGQDTSAPQTFTVTVRPVNDAPTFAGGGALATAEDAGPQAVPAWAQDISAGPPDEAGQAVTFEVVSDTNPGLFAAAPAVAPDGTLTYTPAADAYGSATVTVRARDDGGTTDGGQDAGTPQSFTITVRPVNDAPSFLKGADPSVPEDAGPRTLSGWATGLAAGPANEAAQHLNFEVLSDSNPGLFATPPAVAPDGTLTFTPAADANGSATITLRVRDDGGTAEGGVDASASQSFTIAVRPVNDAPAFTAGPAQAVDEDSGPQAVPGWATGLTAGPADEAGQLLAFEVVSNTNPGLFSAGPAVAADGTLTYTPAPDANGSATITLRVHDDGGTADGGVDVSPARTFTVTVRPVNDAPAARPDAVTATVGRSLSVNVLANDGDVDGDLIRLVSFTTPAHGAVRRQGNLLVYTPLVRTGGTDAFTYTVADGHGGTATGAVSVTITDPIPPAVQAVRAYYGPAAYADLAAPGRSILPWTGITRIAVVFSEDVVVGADNLSVTGAGGPAGAAFTYDPATRTATWALARPLGAGRWTVRLTAAGVADRAGNPLGADWARAVGLLPGDVDGSGLVDDRDLAAVKKKLGTRDAFADANGDGRVTRADYDLVKANRGRRLP